MPSKSVPYYCMGQDAEENLASTNISTEECVKYAQVLAQFDSFFKVWQNTIIERVKFSRTQQHGESVEQFITALYHFVETCEYGA